MYNLIIYNWDAFSLQVYYWYDFFLWMRQCSVYVLYSLIILCLHSTNILLVLAEELIYVLFMLSLTFSWRFLYVPIFTFLGFIYVFITPFLHFFYTPINALWHSLYVLFSSGKLKIGNVQANPSPSLNNACIIN